MIYVTSNGSEMTCPACGARVYRNDDRCLACGVRLDAGKLVGGSADVEAAATMAADGATASSTAATAAGDSTSQVNYDTGAGPWKPVEVREGRGFFDSLSRSWSFLKEAVAMAFRDRSLLLPSLLAVLMGMVLMAAIGGVLYLLGDIGPERTDEEALSTAGYVVLVIGVLLIYVNTYFFGGMTVHLVDLYLRGKNTKLGSAFADCVHNFGGIVTLALASLVVGLIAGAIRGKGRSLSARRAAADTLQRGWMAISYLLLPIMILENSALFNSTDRAKRLHGHNVLQIVVGELGLLIASRIFGGLLITVGVIVAVSSYFAASGLLPVGIAFAVGMFVLGSAFTSYVRTAFYTCLYLWAVAMETVGETAPAPAPLRPALQAGW